MRDITERTTSEAIFLPKMHQKIACSKLSILNRNRPQNRQLQVQSEFELPYKSTTSPIFELVLEQKMIIRVLRLMQVFSNLSITVDLVCSGTCVHSIFADRQRTSIMNILLSLSDIVESSYHAVLGMMGHHPPSCHNSETKTAHWFTHV